MLERKFIQRDREGERERELAFLFLQVYRIWNNAKKSSKLVTHCQISLKTIIRFL